jgi:predicted permease
MNRYIDTLRRKEHFQDDSPRKSIQELYIYADVEGKNTGIENKPRSEAEMKAIIFNRIQTTIQGVMEENYRAHTPIHPMVVANKIEIDAKEEAKRVQAEVMQLNHDLEIANYEHKQIKLPFIKRYISYVILACLCFIGVGDALLSYSGFRFFGLPVSGAIVASIVVFLVVVLGGHFLGRAIRDAELKSQRMMRIALSLIAAFLFFLFLGMLRANAYNYDDSTAVAASFVSKAEHQDVTAYPIAVLSFLTFTLGLYISARFSLTKDQRASLQVYEVSERTIRRLRNEIATREKAIAEINRDKNEDVRTALATYETALANENQLIASADIALQRFINANLRHRTDGECPEYFSNPAKFQFKKFFDKIKNPNK